MPRTEYGGDADEQNAVAAWHGCCFDPTRMTSACLKACVLVCLLSTFCTLPARGEESARPGWQAGLQELEALRADLRAQGIDESNLPRAFLTEGRTKKVLLMVHGIGHSPDKMAALGNWFASHGVNCLAILLDGHGRGYTKPRDDIGRENWRKNLRDGLRLASAFGDQVDVVAYSFGGTVAMDALLTDPSLVGRAVFYAPGLKVPEFFAEELERQGWGRALQFIKDVHDNVSKRTAGPVPIMFVSSAKDKKVDGKAIDECARILGALHLHIPREEKIDHDSLITVGPKTEGYHLKVLDWLMR